MRCVDGKWEVKWEFFSFFILLVFLSRRTGQSTRWWLRPTPCCILNLKLPINTQLQVNLKITINQFLKLVTSNFACSFNSNACCSVVCLRVINRTTSVDCRLATHNRPKSWRKEENKFLQTLDVKCWIAFCWRCWFFYDIFQARCSCLCVM